MAYNQVMGTLELIQGCNLEELAVMRQEMMSHDHTLPEVTQNGRDFTGSHPEVAVEDL